MLGRLYVSRNLSQVSLAFSSRPTYFISVNTRPKYVFRTFYAAGNIWKGLPLGNPQHLLQRKGVLRGCCLSQEARSFDKNQTPCTVETASKVPSFGFLFDIDGVFMRGRIALPAGVEAVKRLVDKNGRFCVPTVFVTNAGNSLRTAKAQTLSELFNVHITAEQVILAHSPLGMFKHYHKKRFLVSGQGPAAEIAESVGFTNIITMEELKGRFPMLDVVDMKRRNVSRTIYEHDFTTIEGILLLGEPVNWETSLQLIIDIMMTDGQPTHRPVEIPRPHLPILACNMDLLWMAEAPLPRFGHGSFLLCLESLYRKLTGQELKYDALVGKPSEATYHHAEYCLSQHAAAIAKYYQGNDSQPQRSPKIKRIYAVGDNPDTDVFGGNLYHEYLQKKLASRQPRTGLVLTELHESLNIHTAVKAGSTSEIAKLVHHKPVAPSVEDSLDELVTAEAEEDFAESCATILVESGVYSPQHAELQSKHSPVSYQHRDFHHEETSLNKPKFVCKNVLEAVDLVYNLEKFTANN